MLSCARIIFAILFLILNFLLANPTFADHPTVGFGSGLSGPIVTIPATTLPKNNWAAGIRTELVSFDTFSDSQLLEFAEAGEDVHSVEELISPFFGLAYGVTDDFTLSVNVPYVLRTDVREAHLHEDGDAEAELNGDSKGIGDLTMLGQYRFVKTPNLGIALLAGLKMPLGRTGSRTTGGSKFEAEQQPGSGSWDPMLGAAVTRYWKRLSLHANVLHAFSTEGTQDTEIGDLLNYNVAMTYRLNPIEDHHHAGEKVEPHPHFLCENGGVIMSH